MSQSSLSGSKTALLLAKGGLAGSEPPPVELLTVLGLEGDFGRVEPEGLRLEEEVPRPRVARLISDW